MTGMRENNKYPDKYLGVSAKYQEYITILGVVASRNLTGPSCHDGGWLLTAATRERL